MLNAITVKCPGCRSQMHYLRDGDAGGYHEQDNQQYVYVKCTYWECPKCGEEAEREEERSKQFVDGRWQHQRAIRVSKSGYSTKGVDLSQFNPDMLQIAMDIRMMEADELADAAKVEAGRVNQFTDGQLWPEKRELKAIAQALTFPVLFFTQEGKRHPVFACSVDDYY